MSSPLAWAVRGNYLEACNCDAICPCRRIGGRSGGRSTTGTCQGALSWAVEVGHAGALDLSGLGVVLACRYHDDEPGSPWTYALYVDERGGPGEREALARIFTGAAGGSAVAHFPWAWKDSRLLGWRAAPIEIEHTPGRGWFRVGGFVEVRASKPVASGETVTCVIPGHERSGRELIAESLEVSDRELDFSFRGNCAYESDFDYRGA